MKTTLSLSSVLLFLFFTQTHYAQLSITSTNTNFIIDFDNTIAGVNNGTIDGTGFLTTPLAGDLDANAWAITGLSDGDKGFGIENTTGDYEGISAGGIGTGGLYAFDISNTGSTNRALGVQPIADDFTSGTITLLVTNNTGSTISNLNVSYDIFVYNDQGRSNSLNFSYSTDNVTYIPVNDLDFTSIETADGSPSWVQNVRATSIGGLSLSNGHSIYLRWTGDDVSGSGSRDEFALDNITVQACDAPSTQASNFTTPTLGTTSMDIEFTRGDGTGGVLILAKQGSTVDATPSSGTTYTGNTTFGIGDEIGTGNYVIFNGMANGVNISTGNLTVSGLSQLTTYYFAVYEYNTSGVCYSLPPLIGDGTTDCVTPPNATNMRTNTGNMEVEVSWISPACGDEVIVVAKEASSVVATPLGSGSAYSANTTFSSGTDIGSNEYIVYKGTGTSVTISGLTNGTTYYFKIFTRRNSIWSTGIESSETPTNDLFYLNEWLIDPDGVTDNPYEYVEIRGNPNTNTTGLYLLYIECDETSTQGQIQGIVNLNTASTGLNGMLVIVDNNGALTHPYSIDPSSNVFNAGDYDIENSSVTLLLIKAPTTIPVIGRDLDNDNDPTNGFDNIPSDWTIFDAVAILDGGTNDQGYANIIFSSDGDGIGLPNSTIIDVGVSADNIHYVMRVGNSTGSAATDWAGMELENPSSNFTIKKSSDVNFQAGAVITNHIGAENPTTVVLPVELTHFNAFQKGTEVLLEWQTASETNNAGFEIQKSVDGKQWEKLVFVEGAGTTFESNSYAFLDEYPFNGLNYYRLKQIDFDGRFEYHKVALVNFNTLKNDIVIYPNPVQNQLIVELPNSWKDMVNTQIFDMTSRLVQEDQINNQQTTLDFSKLHQGQYTIRLIHQNEIVTKSIVKMK